MSEDEVDRVIDYKFVPAPHGYMVCYIDTVEGEPAFKEPMIGWMWQRLRCDNKKNFYWWSSPVTPTSVVGDDEHYFIIYPSGECYFPEEVTLDNISLAHDHIKKHHKSAA